ncbi:retrovirus-related pol polyprotein from transposon TNT 1-94 [Tanacetum coccineum]
MEDMADNWEQRRKKAGTGKSKREQEEERLMKLKEDGKSLYSLEKRVHAGLWVKEIEKMEEAKLGGSAGASDDLDRFLDTASDEKILGKEHVAKYQQFLDEKRGKAVKEGATESSEATKVTKPKAAKATKPAGDKAPKPTATQPPKPKPAPTQPSKAVLEKKLTKKRKPKSPLKLVDEPSDEGVLVEEPAYNEEDANLQRALELSLMEQGAQTQGPACLVTPQKKSLADQFIFQRHPPMPTESSAHVESPSMDAELNLTDSETESDEEASKINAGNQEGQAGPNPGIQDEDQARPNPGEQDEGQAGPNPGIAAESQLQTSHVVHAGPNLEHMDLGTSNASTQQKPEQMDEEFTTTAYPNVQ